ncbi:hypothetical protein TIFTF001_018187 [Ficus carica]|uniref:Uncharacterized protein n=1 Tax=Ficus carica TaxID=3494 RepID=A0AA88AVA0_FICCA|nr:hypothetical protein TIFTF001_018187 [Ficus carica]
MNQTKVVEASLSAHEPCLAMEATCNTLHCGTTRFVITVHSVGLRPKANFRLKTVDRLPFVLGNLLECIVFNHQVVP